MSWRGKNAIIFSVSGSLLEKRPIESLHLQLSSGSLQRKHRFTGGIVMTDRIAALDQYVEQHVQESMLELARLCNQPSISSQGLGMRECAALVAEMLRSRGIEASVMETGGYPVVFGEYGT